MTDPLRCVACGVYVQPEHADKIVLLHGEYVCLSAPACLRRQAVRERLERICSAQAAHPGGSPLAPRASVPAPH